MTLGRFHIHGDGGSISTHAQSVKAVVHLVYLAGIKARLAPGVTRVMRRVCLLCPTSPKSNEPTLALRISITGRDWTEPKISNQTQTEVLSYLYRL